MVRQVDAIFSHGAFQPLEPLAMPEGTRVHLRIEEEAIGGTGPLVSRIHTPKLAHPGDVADFKMEVQETGNAGV
jgi:predicted DNA-binding antitoxin AbrB/MazE fold protein